MSKKLSKEEIDLKIEKSVKKLEKYYKLYQYVYKIKRSINNIDKFLKRRFWIIFIIYTIILLLLLE